MYGHLLLKWNNAKKEDVGNKPRMGLGRGAHGTPISLRMRKHSVSEWMAGFLGLKRYRVEKGGWLIKLSYARLQRGRRTPG